MNISFLSNFSVLQAFTDSNKSIIDCLLPFVEYSIAYIGKEYMHTEQIKDVISKNCGIDIPFNTLKTLLKKLKKLNYITCYASYTQVQVVKNVAFEASGYKNRLEDSNRDITALIADCKKFCGFKLSDEELSEVLFEFIQTYQQYIDISDGVFEALPADISSEMFVKIAEYIIHISKTDKCFFTTFKGTFYGYLLGQFIASNNDVANIPRLNGLTVYIDSNFLLRILDMQATYYNLASKELLDLMKNRGISIVVIPTIVDEVRNVLIRNYRRYINEKDSFLALHGSRVSQIDGIIGAFFRKEMSVTNINEFIDNLEIEIKKQGINIAQEGIESSAKFLEKEKEKITEFKFKNHNVESCGSIQDQERAKTVIIQKALLDAQVLNLIRTKRRSKVYRLDLCKYIFLTCDNVVVSVNSFYHKLTNTLPEAISENKLTNALFMSNPSIDNNVSVALLVSIFKSSSCINYELLSCFHKDLQSYINANPDQSQYLANIFNNQNLFAEIEDIYCEKGQFTEEIIDLDRLFLKAKEKEKEREENELAAREAQKSKMQSEIEVLKNTVEKLSLSSLPIVPPNLYEDAKKKNIKAEKIFKSSWFGLCVIIIVISFVIFLLSIKIYDNWFLDQLWSMLCWCTPFVFAVLFTINSTKDENLNKLMDIIIYDNSTDSLWQVLFIFVLNSLWSIALFAIGIIASLLSDKI